MIPPHVIVGGKLAQILYFGAAPGYPGYYQVNFVDAERRCAGICRSRAIDLHRPIEQFSDDQRAVNTEGTHVPYSTSHKLGAGGQRRFGISPGSAICDFDIRGRRTASDAGSSLECVAWIDAECGY